MKNLVLLTYLQSLIPDYKFKAEYSTNDNDIKVIIVQEVTGEKQVFYGDIDPLYNYFNIQIFGESIKDQKDTSVILGNLIGKSIVTTYGDEKWHISFKQFTNPQTIAYEDIRRVGYTLTLQTIIEKI
jgi:hypothetical protein